MKKEFAEMMLREKMDFLPVDESLKLVENGIRLETRFSYVVSREELDDHDDPRDFLGEAIAIMGDDGYDIGDKYTRYDEFTHEICPAPTYIDLIK